MKKSIRLVCSAMAILLFAVFASSFSSPVSSAGGDKDWSVPDAAKKVKNPVKSSDENLQAGKALFTKHCKSCHGALGKGDGPKSNELNTPCGDFTEKKFQSQTDGELFYKIQKGKEDMPSFEKKITAENDIWTIINYVRTFVPGSAKTETEKPTTTPDDKKNTATTETKKEDGQTITDTKIKTVLAQDSISAALEITPAGQIMKQYEKALNSGDTVAMTALFTSDGIYMPLQTANVSGSEKIKASYKQLFKAYKYKITYSIEEVVQAGDMAFLRASSKGDKTAIKTKQKTTDKNRELIIFKKVNEDWKIYRFMFN